MPCYLPADCLNEIFEYFEKDKFTLHSCLLVNRLWCKVSVRILWRDVWKFRYTVSWQYQLDVSLQILSTLIACLPNESKNLLHKNEIFIPTPTSKLPLFNYASFCKILSIREIFQIIDDVLKNKQFFKTTLSSSKDRNSLLAQEIIKMFTKQISSLKKLTYYSDGYNKNISNNMTFAHFSGVRGCLIDLSELSCSTNISSEFFYQLSQVCRNIQSLTVEFESDVSDGLKDLISAQQNLKHLHIMSYTECSEIIPLLTDHSNTLIKLKISGEGYYGSLSFITTLINLRELILSFYYGDVFEKLDELQYVTFPRLQILKFSYGCPKVEVLIKFLENNGKNLKEFYIGYYDNSLNISIAKFCPNLKSLYTPFMDNETETLKLIFNSCQQLESIKALCGGGYLNENEFLELVAKHSPKNFHELKFYNYVESGLLPKDLEEFFTNWKSRISQRSLLFIVIKGYNVNSLEIKEENMEVIKKYRKLGIIKNFETKKFIEEFIL